MATLALCWLALFLCLPCSFAAQYRFDVWTADDGLPQNIVRGIRQSADGYLWLATLDGLARFDGVKFTTFNKSNTPGITSNRFGSMVQTTDGDLWLSVESGGITRYHAGHFETYGSEHGIPSGIISGMNADHSNHLWILAAGRILQWHAETSSFVDSTPSKANIRYESSIWTNGGFWGIDGNLLFVFHDGVLAHYSIASAKLRSRIWVAAVDPDRSVVFEAVDGTQGRVYPPGVTPPAHEPAVQTTKWVDRNGHLWVMPLGYQLRRSLQDIGGVPGGRIPFSCYFEDRQGNLWIGTEGKGLYRFKRQVIQDYSVGDARSSNLVYPLVQDHAGDIWAGVWGLGLSRFRQGHVTTYPIIRGGSGQSTTSLFEDREHRLWMGTYAGLRVFEKGHFHDPAGITLPEHAIVQAITQGADGTLWFGTSMGLAAFKDGKTTLYTRRDGMATDDVRTLIWSNTANGTENAGSLDDLWIGGYGGLSRLHAGTFSHWYEGDGLPSNTVRSLYQDDSGTLWIGTYDGGLGRLQDGHFTRYTVKDGLFNYGVFAILEDAHENLWMSSNRGIYRVSKRQLNEFAAGQRSAITSVAYGKSDGMLNVECNGGVWPSGIKTADGKLWFPTQDGIAVADPDAIAADDRDPPPVLIEAARLDREPISVDTPLRLPAGKDNLEIEYTALSFIKSDQIHFKYRMAGLESGWTDAGSRRTAYYSHLAPGGYTFQVIAGTEDGFWNLTGKTIQIAVLPPFYRTWWFALLVVATIVMLVAAAWRYRLAQFEAIQAIQTTFSRRLMTTQETERKRIAAELHDGLGQRLVVINQLALLAIRGQKRQEKDTAANETSGEPNPLDELSAETALAIQEIRHISHDLRPIQLDRIGLSRAIQSILRTVSAASGIQIHSVVDNIDDFFPDDLRINLFRIVQEAFNNIMKHSGATEVNFQIQRNGDRLTLRIEDNGRGVSTGKSIHESDGNGLGMQGMMERASLLGGTFDLTSKPGRTIITVDVKHRFEDASSAAHSSSTAHAEPEKTLL